jgi:hypothetical protein
MKLIFIGAGAAVVVIACLYCCVAYRALQSEFRALDLR